MPDLKSKCCNQNAVPSGSIYFCGGVNGCGNKCVVIEPLISKDDMQDSAEFSNFAQRVKTKWWNEAEYPNLIDEEILDELLLLAWAELKDKTNIQKVKDLIVQEMLICHQEGTPTSRLTSLYNKIEGL